ncbi:uncharacterized protein LOC110117905 [Ceratitis capitata]|uniref:uncharacterized protein LOC110117905 n=1 Tax=Ceratitis capitata TaxID=7213 RepID=UPI000A0F8262|nr:uncharacterized protein LOC110117905 [Ceratitis capitata]
MKLLNKYNTNYRINDFFPLVIVLLVSLSQKRPRNLNACRELSSPKRINESVVWLFARKLGLKEQETLSNDVDICPGLVLIDVEEELIYVEEELVAILSHLLQQPIDIVPQRP